MIAAQLPGPMAVASVILRLELIEGQDHICWHHLHKSSCYKRLVAMCLV